MWISCKCPHCGKVTVYAGLVAVPPEPPQPPQDKRMAMSIEELPLHVRSYNSLMNLDIETVGELIKYSSAELLRVKNLGRRSLNDIIAVLAEINLTLRDGADAK